MNLRPYIGKKVLVQFSHPYFLARVDEKEKLPVPCQLNDGGKPVVPQMPFLGGTVVLRGDVCMLQFIDQSSKAGNKLESEFKDDMIDAITVVSPDAPEPRVESSLIVPGR